MKILISFGFLLIFAGLNAQDTWLNYTNGHQVIDVEEIGSNYWIASNGGLCFVDKSTNQDVYYNGGNSELPSNVVNDLFYTSGNELWASTSLGICKITNTGIERGPTHIKGTFNETIDGKLIVADYDSLYIQTTGFDFTAIAYPSYTAEIGNIEVNQATGAIYFNSINYFTETFIAVYENQAWTILFSEYIYNTSMVLDNNNKLWLLSYLGLTYYENGTWYSVPEVGQVDEYEYNKLFVDNNNDLIIEHIVDGCADLLKWNGTTLSNISFTKDDCSDCHFIKPSEEVSDLFFATNSLNGFYNFSASSISDYEPHTQSPLANNGITKTLHTSSNSHYLIFNDQIQLIDNGNWTNIPLPANLEGRIGSGNLDPTEKLWIHDNTALWSLENNQWTQLIPPTDIASDIELMEIGANGDIWIQASLNIARYRNGEWQIFNTGHHNLSSSIIKDLKVDPSNGDLWVSSFQGIRHYDGINWEEYNSPSVNHFFSMAIGQDGVYVRSSNLGIAYISNGVMTSLALPTEGYFGNFELNMTYDLDEEKLYITGTNLIGVYENQIWTTFSTLGSGVYNGFSNNVAIDTNKNVWLSGSRGGLGVFNEDGIISLSIVDDLSTDDLSITVYPTLIENNQFFISSAEEGTYQVVVLDAIGRMVMETKIELLSNQPKLITLPSINTSNLFLSIRKDNKIYTENFLQIN